MLNPTRLGWVDEIVPDVAITLLFVATPFVVLAYAFGQFQIALFVSLPGLLTEAIAVIGLTHRLLRR